MIHSDVFIPIYTGGSFIERISSVKPFIGVVTTGSLELYNLTNTVILSGEFMDGEVREGASPIPGAASTGSISSFTLSFLFFKVTQIPTELTTDNTLVIIDQNIASKDAVLESYLA